MRKSRLLTLILAYVLSLSVLSLAFTAPACAAMGDSWIERASMHQARSSLGVAAVDGKIYAIGGQVLAYQDSTRTESRDVGTNEMYDFVSDSWTEKSPMPIAGSDFATAVYGGKIYCIGGGVTDIFNSSKGSWEVKQTAGFNQVYDPVADNWSNRTFPPTPERHAAAHLVNGRIYLVNGYPDYNLIQVYDPVADNWTQSLLAPVTSSGASAAICDKIYLFSGSVTHIYDTATGAWSTGASPSVNFYKGYAGATTGVNAPIRVYVFCNPTYAPNSTVYVTQIYNPENDTWQMGESMPIQRQNFGVGMVADTFYLVGGYTPSYPTVGSTHQTYGITFLAANEQYYPLYYGAVSTAEPKVTREAPLFWDIVIFVFVSITIGVAVVLFLRFRRR